MPEHKPETFSVYIQWLYSQRLHSSEGPSVRGGVEYNRLLDLFILGDVLQDKNFRNVVIDGLLEKVRTECLYPAGLAKRAFCSLPNKAPFCRLLVDFWVWAGHDQWFQEPEHNDHRDAPQEFWVEVARLTMKFAKERREQKSTYPWMVDPCQYHEHTEGEPKCGQGDK